MSSLARHPEATTYSVQDLTLAVRRGQVRVPRFQRPFQWDRTDVLALFDSIHRGFPIGNLLLWKHPAHAGRVDIGPVPIDAPELSEALWVVDGQQRITALAGALLRRGDTGDDRFDIYLDLAQEEFVSRGKRKVPAHWLPVHAALDTQVLLEWLVSYPFRESAPEHRKVATRFGSRLIEYRVPAYVVAASDEETLRLIFERMNTTGKPLKQADVFSALFAGSGDPPDRVEDLSRDLGEVGFGMVDDAILLKSMLAIEGLDITESIESFKESTELSGATRRAGPALRRALSFLRESAAIPHVELMPATFPLPALARFFALHPDPSARSRDLLVRWTWRALVDHIRQGYHPSRARRAVDAIDGEEEPSVQRLLASAGREPWRVRALPAYSWQGGTTKVVLAALAALAPRDVATGLPIDLATSLTTLGSRLVQRIHPEEGPPLHGHRVLHPPISDQEPRLADALQAAEPEVRRSHLVSLTEGGRLDEGETRERFLLAHVERFVGSRMAVGHSDRASIRHLRSLAADDDAA